MRNYFMIPSYFLVIMMSLSVYSQNKQKVKNTGAMSYQMPFTSLDQFLRNGKSSANDLKILENLTMRTGTEILEGYSERTLELYPTGVVHFVLGRSAYLDGKKDRALEQLKKVPKDHRYFPEARLMLGEMTIDKEALAHQAQCIRGARSQRGSAKTNFRKKYYTNIEETCLMNLARRFYESGNYQASIDAYEKIPKKSLKWPYILLEKAWAYFKLGDYNRALGLLITYKSPLLESYFFPESEYLSALSYFRLCLWEDAAIIVNKFQDFYQPRYEQFVKTISANAKTKNFYFRLLFGKSKEIDRYGEFVKKVSIRVRKQNRFSLALVGITRIDQEIKLIRANKTIPDRNFKLRHLIGIRNALTERINYFAKREIFYFLEDIKRMSQELFKINLEILGLKRDLVYKNKKLISDRSRGDYSNVQRGKFEYFWKFHGPFWADELGDYSLGLKTNCNLVKRPDEQGEEK